MENKIKYIGGDHEWVSRYTTGITGISAVWVDYKDLCIAWPVVHSIVCGEARKDRWSVRRWNRLSEKTRQNFIYLEAKKLLITGD